MSFLWLVVIVGFSIIILNIAFCVYSNYEIVLSIISLVLFVMSTLVVLVFAIAQPFALKSESIRQLKEREQIECQISILDEDSDKVKLNEWILTYNDWVNDVNTSKDVFGWRSWYYNFDMSEHEIINLV